MKKEVGKKALVILILQETSALIPSFCENGFKENLNNCYFWVSQSQRDYICIFFLLSTNNVDDFKEFIA